MSSRNYLLKISLVIIGLLVVLGGARNCQAQGEIGLARAIVAQNRHTNDLLQRKGVVGTAVGHNERGRHVIKVFVATERDAVGIAKKLDGVSVAVQVTGDIVALKSSKSKGKGGGNIDPTGRFEAPVPIGVSTGHPDITAGTIGCRVRDASGNVYVLSNNHVYANENLASLDDPVLQPGPVDGGINDADSIGMLYAFVPIDFDGNDNFVDAAIALTAPDLAGNSTPSNGYGTPRSAPILANIGMKVMKYGRTTGQTEGRIDAINATVSVGYDSGTAIFANQIIISPGGFSAGGDSGSLIVVKDRKGRRVGPEHLKPVGLLFAGSPFVTIANPIQAVLDEFAVDIDGVE